VIQTASVFDFQELDMKATFTLGAASMTTFAAALLVASVARADDITSEHRLGDHPAIVVQRLYKAAGYDYASKFYPHPAWLRLYAEPPRDPIDAASADALAQGRPAPAAKPVAPGAEAPKVSLRSGG
jgi:hypothetical protein